MNINSFRKQFTYGFLGKIGIIVLMIFLGLAIGFFARQGKFPTPYPEVRTLKDKRHTFGELSVFFTKLAQEKGAVYAYEVLRVAPMPPDIDMHLLGHVVGDELYKQKGIDGITNCTQDFRNACSHSIVVGYFLKHGEAGLSRIAQTCRGAPGGSGAYTMCFHGLGHGILAAVDYDLLRTITICEKTGTAIYGFRESSECVGGAIMEITSGGFHNKKLWEEATQKYLRNDDPLYPCNSDLVPQHSRSMCYEYITPHLVAVAGGNLGSMPNADVLTKAFSFCMNVFNEGDKSACYQGFGKEFIVLAHARDIRNLNEMTDEELAMVYELCGLTGNENGEVDCVTHAVDSLFWGGENNRAIAIRFCGLGITQRVRQACFHHLTGAMYFFVKDAEYRRAFCNDLPPDYQERCRAYEE